MAWLYGKAVIDGVPQFHSVSRLSSADPEEEGCLRRWWFEMVLGRKGPKTRASMRGDDSHGQIEKFLKTGERSFSSLVLGGMHMVPEPIKYDAQGRPDMIVEGDLALRPGAAAPITEDQARAALAFAPLRLDSVPLLGRMDLVHARGENKGATSLEDAYDPPGTVEVCDWKTTSDPKWIKPARKLPQLIQMAGYAKWVFETMPDTKQVRLSHAYFVERGGPSRKVSLRVVREEIEGTWERAQAVARSIRDAAKERDPDAIDANLRACDKYGGCPHREVCKAGMHQALARFVGQTAADKLTGRAPAEESVDVMGLLDRARNAGNGAGTPIVPLTPPNTTATAIVPVAGQPAVAIPLDILGPPLVTTIDPGLAASMLMEKQKAEEEAQKRLAAEKAKLEAEEAFARQVEQLRAIYDKFEAYSQANLDSSLGTPAYGQEAAKLYARMRGYNEVGQGYSGTGNLGAKVMITSLEMAAAVLKQLDDLAAAGRIKAPGATAAQQATNSVANLLSPETPAPTNPPPAQPTPTPTQTIDNNAISRPAGEFIDASAGAGAANPPAEPAKKPRAPRKPKETPPAQTPPAESAPVGGPGTAECTDQSISLFVDCVVTGLEVKDLHPLVDEWCDALCKETARQLGLALDAADIRCAPDKSALSYGKWKGALAAMVRENPIPPGAYSLDTRGSEIAEVVADAMRQRCRQSGGAYVRSIR